MNVSSSPNITFMLQYTEANSQYVDYTNRDEAVKIDEELSLETNRQIVEGLTEYEMDKIQEAVPETQLNFREYIDYMNRSYATENQSEELTAVFTQEADYLQKRRLNDLKKISWNQLIKMVLFFGRVLFRLIMLFLLSRDYMMLRLAKLIKKSN